MASDSAIVAAAAATDVRDRREVVLRNGLWLLLNGYSVDDNREVIIDPSGDGGFSIECLVEAGLTPATR